ncbi:MAG: hypothetical protein ACRC9V_02700 [Aeromonas sp.]
MGDLVFLYMLGFAALSANPSPHYAPTRINTRINTRIKIIISHQTCLGPTLATYCIIDGRSCPRAPVLIHSMGDKRGAGSAAKVF